MTHAHVGRNFGGAERTYGMENPAGDRCSKHCRARMPTLLSGLAVGQVPVYRRAADAEGPGHFILQRPLPGGRTVVETFVSAHPELAEADRQMLLGWRDVVEGVFEIRERDCEAIITINLIDELTYRVYSNVGPGALAPTKPGCFMIARIVPIETGWMLSGTQQTLDASQRAGVLQVAAELAAKNPPLVFRNPAKVTQGWELRVSSGGCSSSSSAATSSSCPGPTWHPG